MDQIGRTADIILRGISVSTRRTCLNTWHLTDRKRDVAKVMADLGKPYMACFVCVCKGDWGGWSDVSIW